MGNSRKYMISLAMTMTIKASQEDQPEFGNMPWKCPLRIGTTLFRFLLSVVQDHEQLVRLIYIAPPDTHLSEYPN
jgi:hypothetical protein